LWDALTCIIVQDPDRCTERNGIGTASCDTVPFHEIYQDGFENLTRGRAVWLHKALRKYSKTQLAAAGIDYDAIENPGTAAPQQRATRQPQQPTIDCRDGILVYTAEKGDPATDAIRALPQRQWHDGTQTPSWCWVIAAVPANIVPLRHLYASKTITFTDVAIAALKALAGGVASHQARPATAKTPEPTAAPTFAEKAAAALTEARQQEGMVRVAYHWGEDGTPEFRLKRIPSGQYLRGTFQTAQEAQRAANLLNHGPELS
jgi:hypothetical protein